MKIESGVMIIKNGKAWGISYKDGQSTSYGWISPEDAEIHNPYSCTKTTDVTYKGSPYEKELSTAKLVKVTRTTTLQIHE